MTPEEIKRTIEFILQHQADAALRMDETDRRLQETDRHLRKLAESTNRQFREVSNHIRELADSTGDQIRALAASTARFQDDVKGFIRVLSPILEIQSKRLDRLEAFHDLVRILRAGVLYFAIVFGAGFTLGSVSYALLLVFALLPAYWSRHARSS